MRHMSRSVSQQIKPEGEPWIDNQPMSNVIDITDIVVNDIVNNDKFQIAYNVLKKQGPKTAMLSLEKSSE
jgi:glycerol-3-phosphate O-acyltransferase